MHVLPIFIYFFRFIVSMEIMVGLKIQYNLKSFPIQLWQLLWHLWLRTGSVSPKAGVPVRRLPGFNTKRPESLMSGLLWTRLDNCLRSFLPHWIFRTHHLRPTAVSDSLNFSRLLRSQKASCFTYHKGWAFTQNSGSSINIRNTSDRLAGI